MSSEAAVRLLFTGEAAGAVAAAKETDAAIAGVGRTSAGTAGEVGKLERGALAGSGAFRGLGRSLAFASGAFLAAGGLVEGIKGAVDESEMLEKATASARAALQAAGQDVEKHVAQYEDLARAAAKYGVSEADAMSGLAKATVLTGDATKAQHAYEEALVISKATHVSFESALTATSKAQNGVTTSLQRYGVQVAKGMSGDKQYTMIMQRFGGQAEANTTNLDRLRANAANLGAELGGPLLSVLNLIAGALSATVGWIQRNSAILKPFAAVVGIATAVLGGFLLVTEGIPAAAAAAAGGIDAISVSLYGLPLTWIVLALAAVAVALVELRQRSQTFRDIVNGAWREIKAVAQEVWGWIGPFIKAQLRIVEDVIRIALDLIHGNWSGAWNGMKTLARDVLNLIVGIVRGAVGLFESAALALGRALLNGIKAGATQLLAFVRSLPGRMVSALGNLGHLLYDAGAALVGGLISGVESKVHGLLGAIGGIAGKAKGLFKSALGIFSPSRVFHEYGVNIIQGLINGITARSGSLDRTVAGLSPTLSANVLATTGSAGGAIIPRYAVQTGSPAVVGPGPTYFPNARIQVFGTTERQVSAGLARLISTPPRAPVLKVLAR